MQIISLAQARQGKDAVVGASLGKPPVMPNGVNTPSKEMLYQMNMLKKSSDAPFIINIIVNTHVWQ